jgi:type I restriction enzyme M protein
MSSLSNFVKRIRDIMRNDAGINGDAQRIEQLAWMLFLKIYDAREDDWEIDDDNYQSIIPEECRWRNWAADDKSGKAMTGDTLLNFVNNTLFPTLKNLNVTPDTPLKKSIVKTTFEDANNYMKDGVLLRQVINVIDELDLSDYEESHAFGEIYESILRELQSAGSAGEFYTPRAVTDFMAKMIKPKIGEKMADFACGTGGFITSWLKELAPQVKTTADQAEYANSIYGIEKKQFPYMLCITNMLLHGLDVPNIYHDNALLRDVLDYTEDDQFDVILMNPPYGGSEKADVKNHFPADLASSETADLFMSVIMYRLKKNGRAAVILPDGFLFGTDNAKVNIKKKLLSEFNLHTIIRLPSSVFAPYTSITTNILFFDRTEPTSETWYYRLDMPEGYKHFSKTKPMKLEHFAPVIEWWNNRQEINIDGFDKAKKYTVKQLSDDFGYNLDLCGYPHEEEVILEPLDLIRQYEEKRASLNAEIDREVCFSFLLTNPGTASDNLFEFSHRANHLI